MRKCVLIEAPIVRQKSVQMQNTFQCPEAANSTCFSRSAMRSTNCSVTCDSVRCEGVRMPASALGKKLDARKRLVVHILRPEGRLELLRHRIHRRVSHGQAVQTGRG